MMAVILPALPIGTKRKTDPKHPSCTTGRLPWRRILAENAPAVLEFSRATGHLAARISTTRIQSSKTPKAIPEPARRCQGGWASCWGITLPLGKRTTQRRGLPKQRMMYRARRGGWMYLLSRRRRTKTLIQILLAAKPFQVTYRAGHTAVL